MNRNVKVIVSDIDKGNLSFETNFFDFILSGNPVELVLDPDHLLEELYHVLSPNVHLIVTFSNLCVWVSRITALWYFHPHYYLASRRYDVGKLYIPVTKYKNESKDLFAYMLFVLLNNWPKSMVLGSLNVLGPEGMVFQRRKCL